MADEDVKTLAVKLALYDGTFTQGMNQLKQNLKLTDSEFKAAGGTVKNFGSTLDGVKANAQSLSDKIGTQKEIIAKYQEQMAKTQAVLQEHSEALIKNKAAMDEADAAYRNNLETLGANDEATKKSKQDLDEATAAYERNRNQVIANQKSIEGYTIAINKATGEIKKMQSELADINAFSVVGKNLEDTGKKVESVGSKMSSVGQSLTWGVSVPIAAAGAASVKMAMDFETSSAKVSTIADSAVVSMDKMKQGTLDLSTETNTDVNDINQALYQAMSAGIKTGDSLKFVGDSVKLSKGGFTDTTTAINTLTSVLNAYHMKASDANAISDQLIKTQDLGKTTVGELGQSLGQVIPIAASMNVKTQDLFASIAELTKNGMPADEAITAIKGALSGVLKPTTQAAGAAKDLGLNFTAAHLQNVGFAAFIDEIAKATGGNSQKMAELFGNVRALNGMTVLAGKGNQDFNATLQDMNSATGATNDAFEKVEDNGAAKFEKAINTLKNDGIKAGEDLMPAVTGIADDVANLTDKFSQMSPQAQQTIVKIAAITAAIGPAVWAIGSITKGVGGLIKGFGSYVDIVGKVIDKLGIFQNVTKGVQDAEEAATVVKGVSTAATEAESVAAGEAAAATGALDVALLPIIGIAVGVAAAIAGITVGAIALANHLSQSSIPSVQLFGSETDAATKKAVSAYENLNNKATGQLMSLEASSAAVTSQTAGNIENTFGQMAQQIEQGFDKKFSDSYNAMVAFFANTKVFTAAQETEMEADSKAANDKQKAQIQAGLATINQIINNASSQHRQLTSQEQQQIFEIQQSWQQKAITALSTSEQEAKAIYNRAKDSASITSAQAAADVVKNAAGQRDKTVKAANDQATQTINAATYMHDTLHSITDDEEKKMISGAENQKTQVVNKANEMFDSTVSAAKQKVPQFVNQINWQTGQTKTIWQQLKDSAHGYSLDTMGNYVLGLTGNSAAMGSALAQIYEDIKKGLDKHGDSKNWGADLISNFVSGMKSMNNDIDDAANWVATKIKNVLGHSVPKEGPLKDELDWMPHMGQNLEKGLLDNAPKLQDAARKNASAIANGMSFDVSDVSRYQSRIQSTIQMLAGSSGNQEFSVSSSEIARAVGQAVGNGNNAPTFNINFYSTGDVPNKNDIASQTKLIMNQAYLEVMRKRR